MAWRMKLTHTHIGTSLTNTLDVSTHFQIFKLAYFQIRNYDAFTSNLNSDVAWNVIAG